MLFHNWELVYHMKHNVHTTFYHSVGLTRNLMFNGNIYYVKLYLQILHLGRVVTTGFWIKSCLNGSLNGELLTNSEFMTLCMSKVASKIWERRLRFAGHCLINGETVPSNMLWTPTHRSHQEAIRVISQLTVIRCNMLQRPYIWTSQ